MRFAIALLTVICIASVIGTVVEQHQPYTSYVDQFGPFWAELFGKVSLYTVYGAWWFVLILAFLVTSVSLCIIRNAPKIVHDLRTFKESVREQSLAAHHHRALGLIPAVPQAALAQVAAVLERLGWRAKVQVRDHGIMVAGRRGAANKIGYLAAHGAVVLICVGGLLDGDLLLRGLMWAQGRTVYAGSGPVLEKNVLPAGNPGFRGSIEVPEGGAANVAQLSLADGVVLQQLPFDIELKKFVVEFYPTGQPRLFASDIVLRDRATGARREATVKVNEPVIEQGIAIYQSSFSDGGSQLSIAAEPMTTKGRRFTLGGKVGSSTQIVSEDKGDALTLEFTDLRVMNVENLGGRGEATDARKVDLVESLGKHLGSGAKNRSSKEFRNIGPAFSYKLRDAAGQAREFHNYMAPVVLDDQLVFLAGVRDGPAEEFRYLRIPADERLSMDSWLHLRGALLDPMLRERAARRYARSATPVDKPQMQHELEATALQTLNLFSGAVGERPKDAAPGSGWGGLPSLSQFIDTRVPAAERQRVSEALLRMLNGSLFELYQISRELDEKPPRETDADAQKFMVQSVLSLSDSMYYPAPVLLRLDDFKQVQASVFQVARAPGQKIVYLGAALLIIGVFAMLFVKERRVWIWLEPAPGEADATRVRMALSSTRESPDTVAEFEQLRDALLKESKT
ncbi:MAG: cytochrome c biogenesis protein ResB [Paucibacter sp.]|nr:cytochrome c biogenesis protein ResB [Roseateles sp.]